MTTMELECEETSSEDLNVINNILMIIECEKVEI